MILLFVPLAAPQLKQPRFSHVGKVRPRRVHCQLAAMIYLVNSFLWQV